jgi:hypothetical protein
MTPMPTRPFGWIDDPAHRAHAQAAMGLDTLAVVAPHLMIAAAPNPPADILLYRAWKDVLGSYPNYPAQQIGDCESFGHGHGGDLDQCVEAALEGSDLDYRETCTEALYAAGREAGGMLGWQDGCDGAAMVQAMRTIGVVPREAVGAYSGQRARQWGHDGLPGEVRKIAAGFTYQAAALVTTADEAIAALANGLPVTISSDCGFEGGGGFRRDAQGICQPGGSWPHCMVIVGRISSDGVDTFVIAQSWGNAEPPGPCPFDMPPFCFRARRDVVEPRILAQRDSYALSKAPAFKHRPLPASWTVAGWGG